MDVFVLLLIHLLLSFAAGSLFNHHFRKHTGESMLWKWLVVVFTFFIPVYGPIGLIFVFVLASRQEEKGGRSIRYDEHLQSQNDQPSEDGQIMEHYWRDTKEIQPILEILKGGDIELKKGAINALSLKADTHSIALLKGALSYSDLDVRYFIVEALSKIGQKYMDAIYAANSKLKLDPDSEENNLEVGNSYYDLASCGIEVPELSRYYYKRAVEYYSLIALNGLLGDAEKKKYGLALKQIGRFDEALDILRTVGREQFSGWRELSSYLDIYFQRAEYSRLSEIAKDFSSSESPTYDAVEKSLSLWVQ